MLRRLFTFLSIVSLLLCVATCVLWVRHRWVADVYMLRLDRGTEVAVSGVHGTYWFQLTSPASPSDIDSTFPEPVGYVAVPAGGIDVWSNGRQGLLGFGYEDLEMADRTIQTVGIPHWFVCLMLAAAPTVKLIRLRRERSRENRGLCPSCGYDLRASPKRCPECGAVPASAKPSL